MKSSPYFLGYKYLDVWLPTFWSKEAFDSPFLSPWGLLFEGYLQQVLSAISSDLHCDPSCKLEATATGIWSIQSIHRINLPRGGNEINNGIQSLSIYTYQLPIVNTASFFHIFLNITTWMSGWNLGSMVIWSNGLYHLLINGTKMVGL